MYTDGNTTTTQTGTTVEKNPIKNDKASNISQKENEKENQQQQSSACEIIEKMNEKTKKKLNLNKGKIFCLNGVIIMPVSWFD